MDFPEQYPPKVKLQMRNVMRNTFQAKHINISMFIEDLRWYHTLQGDNSLKSVERFDHMMFVCRFQASL